jgi:hypothetical protein
MSVFGELEQFFSEVVYPVWPLFAVLAIAVIISAAYVAVRLGWHVIALRRRLLTAAAVVVLLAVAVPIGYYTISPIFERNTVCEASPISGADTGSDECDDDSLGLNTDDDREQGGPDAPADPTDPPSNGAGFEARAIAQGEFRGADNFHFGEGQALLIETAPSEYTLRFENFSVRNGPDLYVYLSPSADGYADGALELGTLKGTDGAFNYAIPPGTDVSQFQSAVVWCKAFSVLFAHATLA